MFGSREKNVLRATHMLHDAVCQSRPQSVAQCLRKRADANLLLSPPGARYSGNAYHAFATIRHGTFGARDVEVLRELGFSTADINLPNAAGQTPLHLAVAVYDKLLPSAQAVRAFVSRGANVHARDGEGCTPLHALCADRWSDEAALAAIAAVLLDAGARCDERMDQGTTPMMLAARNGHADLCAMMAHKGANIHARDDRGLRASDYARAAGHYALAEHLLLRENAAPACDAAGMSKPEWTRLGDDRVCRTTIENPIRYKLTEIFNFRSNTYTCITQNLQTRAEAVTVRSFAELDDGEMIAAARQALERRGGQAGHSPYGRRKPLPVRIDKPAAGKGS